jgi:hypothetical protein
VSAALMIPIAILLGVAFRNKWFGKVFRRKRKAHEGGHQRPEPLAR